jgi:hypothetical protein
MHMEPKDDTPASIPSWLSHLPGCPQLKSLVITYMGPQHHSAHPRALVGLLAQHNREITSMVFAWDDEQWDAEVAGLPAAAGPVDREWRPDASLASLKKLEFLQAECILCLRHPEDWQHLAQLTELSYLLHFTIMCAPPPLAGLTLSLVQLDCSVGLGGADLGGVLLACPRLQCAHLMLHITTSVATAPGGMQLVPHPSLQSLQLGGCGRWAPAAPSHWSALAPVLAGVTRLSLSDWPSSSSSQPRGGLPDLSPSTALRKLSLECSTGDAGSQEILPEQEDFLAMLAPLVQLQNLVVSYAPRLNARVAVTLQHMLPQLRECDIFRCGKTLPVAAAEDHQQGEEEILGKVKQLLRPGLQLRV